MTLYGGLITKRALCYTIDGKLLLAPCGNDIRIYSAASGDNLTTLKGHGAEVTAVVQDPSSDKVVCGIRWDCVTAHTCSICCSLASMNGSSEHML